MFQHEEDNFINFTRVGDVVYYKVDGEKKQCRVDVFKQMYPMCPIKDVTLTGQKQPEPFNIRGMKLFDVHKLPQTNGYYTTVQCVPGGWTFIYDTGSGEYGNQAITSVFVPDKGANPR